MRQPSSFSAVLTFLTGLWIAVQFRSSFWGAYAMWGYFIAVHLSGPTETEAS